MMRFTGWLNALTAATTPIGSCSVNAMRPADGGLMFIGITCPASVRSISAHEVTPSIARRISPRESMRGLPPSRAAASARASACDAMIAASRRRISMRFAGGEPLGAVAMQCVGGGEGFFERGGVGHVDRTEEGAVEGRAHFVLRAARGGARNHQGKMFGHRKALCTTEQSPATLRIFTKGPLRPGRAAASVPDTNSAWGRAHGVIA
jgi:hypothetical protein